MGREDFGHRELSQIVALYNLECLWGLDSLCGPFPPSEDTWANTQIPGNSETVLGRPLKQTLRSGLGHHQAAQVNSLLCVPRLHAGVNCGCMGLQEPQFR